MLESVQERDGWQQHEIAQQSWREAGYNRLWAAGSGVNKGAANENGEEGEAREEQMKEEVSPDGDRPFICSSSSMRPDCM